MLKASLLITTYNWKEALELILLNVFNQTRLPDEIVIADDGSRDDTRRTIDRLRLQSPVPIVHVWRPDDGPRRSEIRNRGIAAASGDYIIVVDGDILPEKHFVEDHLFYARRGVCLCGRRFLMKAPISNRLLENNVAGTPRFFTPGLKLSKKTLRSRFLTNLVARNVRNFDPEIVVMTANMSFWRDDAIRINGFDEAFATWGLEDLDFALRLRHAGIALKLIHFSANCFHLFHPSNENKEMMNRSHFDACIAEKRIRATIGIDRYL